jgi:hypothetical protein
MAIITYHSRQNVTDNDGLDPTIISGNFTTIVDGVFNASNSNFIISLDPGTITRPGQYVIIKATSITGFSSSTLNFSSASFLSPRQVRRELVKYPDGLTYDCVIVSVG